MAEPRLATRFTRAFGITHPVMQEGLGPYKTVALAAAVSNAGGLGTVSIPGISEEPRAGAAKLRGYIEEACALTDKPFAVNIPVGTDKHGNVPAFSAAYVQAVVDAVKDGEVAKRLRAITTSAGAPSAARGMIEGSGLIHIHKVGGTRQALRAVADGVDMLIASGYEAGGHTHSRPVHTFVLGPSVTEAVDVPVILAGGVRDGRGLAAALAMGADAVALGTRFVASHDNPDWHPNYAARILAAREGDDTLFQALYGPSRILPSRAIGELHEFEQRPGITEEDLTRFKDERLIAGQRDGDMDGGILPCGQVAGALTDLIHVAEFVPGMVREAIAAMERMRRLAV
jgi:NAD(P)H-dependent flavin oxidoreductase YrpB (nitropropane dioxygenase family)